MRAILYVKHKTHTHIARKSALFAIILILASLVGAGNFGVSEKTAYAAVSSNLNFQARLQNASGGIVPDGFYNIQFNLYTVSAGGSTLWTESYLVSNSQGLRVKNGYFSANLGSITSFPGTIDWDQEHWLGMTVRGTGSCAFGSCTPADAEMNPRFKITAVPYAFKAAQAANVQSAATNAASTNSNNVSVLSGNATGATSNSGNITIDSGTATGTAGQLLFGTTNASALTIGRTGVTTTLQGAVAITGAGTSLTVTNDAAFNGNTTIGNASSDTLTVNSDATFTGNLTVNTGDTFTNSGSSLYTAQVVTNLAGGGTIGTAAATVDGATTFNINQTTAGQALTLPPPTNTTAGRVVYVNNVGSASFTMYGTTIATSGSNAFIWNGSAWVTTVSLSGSSINVVGTIDSQTKSSDGAVISGNAIYLQTADISSPGLVSTGVQSFAGDKSFTGNLTVDSGTFFVDSTNNFASVGGTSDLGGKFQVVGTADETQLLVRANATQSLSNPLVLLQNSSGTELARINASTSSLYFGNGAGGSSASGVNNLGIGASALGAVSTGTANTSLGSGALASVSINSGNTAVGYNAGNLVTGTGNILFGYQAGDNITTGSNNIIIGYGLDASSASVSNELRIGGVLQGDTSTLAAQFNGALTVVGLTTLNGGLTLETGDTLTVNGDAITDLTGAGLSVVSGALSMDTVSASGAFVNGGNGFTANSTLGNNGNFTLGFETNNTTRFVIAAGASTLTGQGATTITSTGTLALSSAAASNLDITTGTTGVLTLDSGTTGAVNLGTGTSGKTVNIGTGAGAVNTIAIGGTGANVITVGNTQTGGSIAMGAAMTTGTITIGGTGLQTGAIGIGTGTGAQAINLGTGGTGAKAVTVGSTASTGTTTIQSGSGGVLLQPAGSNVVVGVSDTTGTLLVLDTKTDVTDPTGVNGGMYYNSNTGNFRFYQNGAWMNLGTGDVLNGGQASGALVLGTNTANTLTLETNNQSAMTILSGGATTFQNAANSNTAFKVSNAGDTWRGILVDTANNSVSLGQPSWGGTFNGGVPGFHGYFENSGQVNAWNMQGRISSTTGSNHAGYFLDSFIDTPNTGGTRNYRGVYTRQQIDLSANTAGSSFVGIHALPDISGTGSATSVTALQANSTIGASATVDSVTGLFVNTVAQGTVNNNYGIRVVDPMVGSGVTTNNYGMYIDNQSAGTNDYGLYIQGADTYALWVDSGESRFDGQVTIGVSDTTGTLLVLDTKTDVTDPTGVNGGMYYNSNLGRFRCYENNAWVNCTSSGIGSSLFTDAGAHTYLTSTSDQLVVGSSSSISAKLGVVGTANQTQLVVRANATQTSPLIMAQDSSGNELFRLHAPDNTSIFLGSESGSLDDGGNNNTAVGNSTLRQNVSGVANAAFGGLALANTTSSYNSAFGNGALYNNTTGQANTAVGEAALYGNFTGQNNVGIGSSTLRSNDGSNNTVIGTYAGYAQTTGDSNIYLGYQAGNNQTSGSSNIAIGVGVNVANLTGSNQLNIAGLLTSSNYTTGGTWNGTLAVTGTSTFTGLLTANGGLTLEAGDTLTVNGDALTDLTGTGLTVVANALTVDATTAAGFFKNGGNAFTANSTLGNTGNYNLNIMTNNLTRLTVENDGDVAFDTNTLFVDANNDKVGIGTTTLTNVGKLQVTGTAANVSSGSIAAVGGSLTSSTNSQNGLYINPAITPGATSAASYAGLYVAPTSSSSNFTTNSTISGIVGAPSSSAAGLTGLVGGNFSTSITGGSVGLAVGLVVGGNSITGGSVTNNVSAMISENAGGTNSNINLILGSGAIPAGDWSIYNMSTRNNAIAGNLRVGGTTAPTVALDVTGAGAFSGALTVNGLTTLNGGLTMETGDTFTFNGDAFTDLTGAGLTLVGNALTVDTTSATGFFQNGGNNFGGNATIGTNGASQTLSFETNNTDRFVLSSTASTLTGQGATTLTSTGAMNVQGAAGSALGVATTTTTGAVNIGTSLTSGILTIGGTGASTGAINLGTGTGAQTLNLGTGATGAKTINIGTGAVANPITIGNTTGATSILLQSGTGDVAIQSQDDINIGTNAVAQDIAIGNTTGATSLNLQAGTGNITMQGVAATTIAIGSTAQTGAITLGQSTASNTINIGSANTANGNIQTINIGAGVPAGTGRAEITIGNTANASALNLAAGTGLINFNTTQAQFTEITGTRNLTVQTRTTNVAGSNLRVSAGDAGAGAGAFTGGALTLQGGNAAGTGNANGGNVILTGGAGVGTGVRGLVVVDTATFSAATVQNFTANGNITQSNIDTYGSILISGNVAGWVATLTDPANVTAGRVVYITNSGSVDITLAANSVGIPLSLTLKPATTATMYWNGTDWTAAGASSSTDLQAAYNNTATSAGGAELVLNAPGGNADGLTIRNNNITPITGGLLEVQTSIGSNLFTVNNNATEFATNGGAETQGASASTFPANTWDATTGGTITRYTTTGSYVATGQASVSVVTGAVANQGARNRINTTLTSGVTYTVSFAVRGTISFSTLDIRYSPDGTTAGTTQCATAQTVTTGQWTRITCSFIAGGTINANNSILIRQTDATARTFYIDNLSVNVNASITYAADGSVDNAGAFSTNWTNYQPAGTATVAQETSIIYDSNGSARVTTSATAGIGMRNNLAIQPQTNTQYLVSFFARSSVAMTGTLRIGFLPAGGTGVPAGDAACTDYSTQTLSNTAWVKVTCLFTTGATAISNADLVIYQSDAVARIIYVDALSITLNTNNSNNVQLGGGNKGGPVTLFTLDRSAGDPIAANNDAYLGSMYYDTVSGRIQCYEADGWGACGAAPDNIVNLNPEYAGAVLNGTGVGTMTADFCGNGGGLSINVSLCAGGEAKNYYKWTSPQASMQTYSIFVTYQLPATFNGFTNDDIVQLAARVDNTTNSSVTYEMFKSVGGTLTQCGTGETDVITGNSGTANNWYTYGINGNEATGCSFNASSANGFVIFKINMKARSNASAYVGTLNFVTAGR